MNFCRDDLFCVSREIYSISILYLYIPMVCLVDGGLGMGVLGLGMGVGDGFFLGVGDGVLLGLGMGVGDGGFGLDRNSS